MTATTSPTPTVEASPVLAVGARAVTAVPSLAPVAGGAVVVAATRPAAALTSSTLAVGVVQ